LNDNDPKVTQVALSVLDEACDEPSCLEAVIKHNPPLLKHGKPGKNLMLRFMSSTNGLRLLKDANFIHSEMQLWKDEENVAYLQSIEASLSEALSPTIWRQREGADQSNYGVYFPPHFYGELTKNAEGCEILRQSGHFEHILATAFDNNTAPLLRRAALIALGHIGSSPTGFTFLEESKAVFTIVNICETCSCLSIRGTCFYVLGMISRIERSREILDQCGWESPAELHSCISVPKNIHTNPFLKVPRYEHCGSGPVPEAAGEGLDDIGKEVLGYVGKLSNHITADSASRNLKRMRAKHPEHFSSAVMLHFVFQLMAGYKFRLGVRRFVPPPFLLFYFIFYL
jgi:rapamycin-insensitive companion of mTOR